jgi:hypothetical protein
MNQFEYLAKVLKMTEESIKKPKTEEEKQFKIGISKHFPEPKWIEGGRNHSAYSPGGY